MIDLYTWHTPNGRKVSIMLEEIGIPYEVHSINIAKDEQFQPHFLNICPNNKIPAIVGDENYLGVQFHPEKSSLSGQKLISNWLKWSP